MKKKMLAVLITLFSVAVSPVMADEIGPEPTAIPVLPGEPEPELSRKPCWQQLFPATNPSPRASHAMGYDTMRDVDSTPGLG